MQTDSLLKPYDRVVLEEMIHESDVGNRIARELSRLEQENQRLQARVDSLDCAHKLALGEVERLKKDNHRLRLEAEGLEEVARRWQASWNVERNDLSAFRAEIQRLRGELENPFPDYLANLRESERKALRDSCDQLNEAKRDIQRLTQENAELMMKNSWLGAFTPADDFATTRDALTAARAEVQRLRGELDAEKVAATYWQDQYNIRNDVAISVGDQLAAARAEVQRLRENAEMDKAQRAEWQETIDKLEAENASIRNQLRLALIISEPKQVDSVMERIEKMESDASRVALLEGRIQGIAEAAKERLDSHDFRLRALEANGWSGIPVTVASNIPPFNQGYNDGKPARNPFEDLRPPRGL